jgi:hypothetical protein
LDNGVQARRLCLAGAEAPVEDSKMNTDKVIVLARKHLGGAMESSARLCLSDALGLYEAGDLTYAKKRALKSLAYSVGIFHSDYARASK